MSFNCFESYMKGPISSYSTFQAEQSIQVVRTFIKWGSFHKMSVFWAEIDILKKLPHLINLSNLHTLLYVWHTIT